MKMDKFSAFSLLVGMMRGDGSEPARAMKYSQTNTDPFFVAVEKRGAWFANKVISVS
jgi:hypothetical protein